MLDRFVMLCLRTNKCLSVGELIGGWKHLFRSYISWLFACNSFIFLVKNVLFIVFCVYQVVECTLGWKGTFASIFGAEVGRFQAFLEEVCEERDTNGRSWSRSCQEIPTTNFCSQERAEPEPFPRPFVPENEFADKLLGENTGWSIARSWTVRGRAFQS